MKLPTSTTALAIAFFIAIPVGSVPSARGAAADTNSVIHIDNPDGTVELQSESSLRSQVTPSRNSTGIVLPTAKNGKEPSSRGAEFPSYCTSDSSTKADANLFLYQEALHLCKFGS